MVQINYFRLLTTYPSTYFPFPQDRKRNHDNLKQTAELVQIHNQDDRRSPASVPNRPVRWYSCEDGTDYGS